MIYSQMCQFKSSELFQLVKKIQLLRDHADSQKKILMERYSSLDVINDARLTTFAKFINVTNSTQLAMTFIGQHLLDPLWW
jgi:hypothetical protein